MRFASKPLFYWEMTGNSLELFRKFFGAVRAIVWFCGSFLAPKKYRAIWGIAAIVSQYRVIWGSIKPLGCCNSGALGWRGIDASVSVC